MTSDLEMASDRDKVQLAFQTPLVIEKAWIQTHPQSNFTEPTTCGAGVFTRLSAENGSSGMLAIEALQQAEIGVRVHGCVRLV